MIQPINIAQFDAARFDILKMPIAKVMAAWAQFGDSRPLLGSVSNQKNTVADNLAEAVCLNKVTMDAIRNVQPAGPSPFAVAPNWAPQPPTLDPVLATVANRASADALDALQAVQALKDSIKNDLTHISARLSIESTDRQFDQAQIKDGIDRLTRKVEGVKIDDRKVEEAVAKVVADAFAPFKQAVEAVGAQAVVADLSSVRVVSTETCLDAFGVNVLDRNGNQLSVDIWNDPTAPAVDPHFIWTESILQHLLLSQDTGENVWFGGPKGTGKSETARQFAAVTGRAFKRINFHKYTSAEDYIGAVGLEGGQTVFKRGDFLAAFTHPSTVILLDEVTNADPGELAPLNGFLEPNSAVSFGGGVQTRAPGVLVFAADNTLGNGDDSGRYAGTRAMNSALVDRFARVIEFGYLPLSSEVEAVVRHTGCKEELAEHILTAVRVAREKVQTGEVIDAPSIRSVIAFIRALRVLPIDKAWATTIAARQPVESLPGLTAIYLSCISEPTINQYL
jgi:MoxR-like ATPase